MSDQDDMTASTSQVVPEKNYIEVNGWEFTELTLEWMRVTWSASPYRDHWLSRGYYSDASLYCVVARDAVGKFQDESSRTYQPLSTILNQFGAEGWELVHLEMPPYILDASASGSLSIGNENGSVDFDVRSSDWFSGKKPIVALFKRPKTYYKLRPGLRFADLTVE